jgi:hypothetical protein
MLPVASVTHIPPTGSASSAMQNSIMPGIVEMIIRCELRATMDTFRRNLEAVSQRPKCIGREASCTTCMMRVLCWRCCAATQVRQSYRHGIANWSNIATTY